MRAWLSQYFTSVVNMLLSFAAVSTVSLGAAFSSEDQSVGTRSQTSFEQAKAGEFQTLETAIGTWRPNSGRTIVDDKHAKTGFHCLQLTGGNTSSVILDLAENADTSGQVSFWAERWTKRQPFSFRIEKNSKDGWLEIFNGDNEVKVGREFLSEIVIPLGDDAIRQLKFTVTSPPNTGILIDDVRLAAARPQRIVGVENVPSTLPSLVGVNASPLLKLKIETSGSLNPISLTQLQASLQFQDEDVESAQLYFTGNSAKFSTQKQFGTPIDIARATHLPVSIVGDQQLHDGNNYIWVACKLRDTARIDNTVGAECLSVKFSNGESFDVGVSSTQRMGVALRQAGDEGNHTYRIPGLATTNQGSLIGVYDVRRRSGGDLPGDIDVGMSRSTDGGQTWDPMKVIMNMGSDPDFRHDGIGDPAILVDKVTGTIWVAATWSHGDRSWRGSGPGLTPDETGQLMLVRSDDDGVTWTEPINITSQVKKPEWSFILQGPGKGITMLDGTLVFPAQYQDPTNATDKLAHRLPHSTIIYSKDHGETWNVGTGAFDDTTESQVVEVTPGVLMLNCRYNRKTTRVVMTTQDMGKTWQRHASSERSLIEPRACMASLIDVDREVGTAAEGWLLFSNPDSTRSRSRITIKASADRGMTWPKQHRLMLDEERGAGYSCMSMIDAETVGILYEGSQAHMTFQRISLQDLIDQRGAETKLEPSQSKHSLRLPNVFGDHMVLQAESKIPVWGTAEPGQNVTVDLAGESISTAVNGNGKWSVSLPPQAAKAAASKLTIRTSSQQIEFEDVLVGEVWVCAGQSNMEWPLAKSEHGHEELSAADHGGIRLLQLNGGAGGGAVSYSAAQLTRLTPENYAEGSWRIANADSAAHFSAVAWYFGKQLQEELAVPVGLICPAVGGTPTESWIPQAALEADPQLCGLVAGNWLDNETLGEFCRSRGLQNLLEAIQAGETIPRDELGPNHSFKPGFMWEAGMKPLIPYAIRGAIWYQGESNAETRERIQQHEKLFPLMIEQWRHRWGQGDFPFLYVQLPALNRPEWPLFRESQRRMLDQLKNAGMAVTIDTGHPSNVHPLLKKPVGQRLAKLALGTTYNSELHSIYSGPLVDGVQRAKGVVMVSFKHVGDGLKLSGTDTVPQFEVCGNDGNFHPALAVIKGTAVIEVSSPQVNDPQHVRYAWEPYPDPAPALTNSVGLPASPFSTESTKQLFANSVIQRTLINH